MKGRDKTASEAMKSSPTKHIIQIKMKHSFEKGVTHTPNSSCQFMYKRKQPAFCMNLNENGYLLFVSS